VGDVGQDRIEEIDLVQSGKNYGWNIVEGSLCYNPPSGCNETGLEPPVYEYNHTIGNAIIGGYVYHGQEIPTLAKKYVYGDYGSGRIWAFSLNGSKAIENSLLFSSSLTISSFGEDQQGELYLCAFDGKIYKITSTAIPEISFQSFLTVMIILFLVVVGVKFRRISFLSLGR
jgi:glucose/arabinose dehydrogenase